ncbi:hypothetical protein GCK32_020369, partial [Trichostrongylus colubriformis]
ISTVPQDRLSTASILDLSAASSQRSAAVRFDRFRHHKQPIFNVVKTLETIKPHRGDFRSIIFSKFLQSDRLGRLVEEAEAPSKKMVTCECQTDDDPRAVVEPQGFFYSYNACSFIGLEKGHIRTARLM